MKNKMRITCLRQGGKKGFPLPPPPPRGTTYPHPFPGALCGGNLYVPIIVSNRKRDDVS
jgi:hypothetical protein